MVKLLVNRKAHDIDVEPDTPLLYVLRDDLRLNGAKFGCGLGQCGSCTVLVEGEPVFACLTPVMVLEGKEITTLEGLGTVEEPGPIQQAFIAEQSAQCGYCIPGMMMRAQGLLQKNPRASDAEIRDYMQPNLCRCGTHMRILRAVKRAAGLIETAQATQAGAGGQGGGS
jgi:nicotinate dehydrogenase subunit A